MGCKTTILTEPLLKNHNVKFVAFGRIRRHSHNGNFCLFKVLALPLHGNDKLEEDTSENVSGFSVTGGKEVARKLKVFT